MILSCTAMRAFAFALAFTTIATPGAAAPSLLCAPQDPTQLFASIQSAAEHAIRGFSVPDGVALRAIAVNGEAFFLDRDEPGQFVTWTRIQGGGITVYLAAFAPDWTIIVRDGTRCISVPDMRRAAALAVGRAIFRMAPELPRIDEDTFATTYAAMFASSPIDPPPAPYLRAAVLGVLTSHQSRQGTGMPR
jgi:hypothetical protein